MTSFTRAPSGSEGEEAGTETGASPEVADADAEQRLGKRGSTMTDEGVWRSLSMEEEEEVVSSEDEGGADPGRGGEEEETRFSLLSLPSVSVTPARG